MGAPPGGRVGRRGTVRPSVVVVIVVIVVIIVIVCTDCPPKLVALRAPLTLVGHHPQLVLVQDDVVLELGEVSLDAAHHLGLLIHLLLVRGGC